MAALAVPQRYDWRDVLLGAVVAVAAFLLPAVVVLGSTSAAVVELSVDGGYAYDTVAPRYDPSVNHALQVKGHHAPSTALDRPTVGTSGRSFALSGELHAPEATTLLHYTDEAGQAGILSSGELRPSLGSVNPNDVRYGDGQYLSDIVPGTRTCAQLSRCFLGQPFQGQRFTHYVEIDVSDLNVIKGRDGVFVVPNDGPLSILDRLVSAGVN